MPSRATGRAVAVILCLAAASHAQSPKLMTDTLQVELRPDAPRVVSITHRPSGARIDGPGAMTGDWEILTPGGAVKLSQATVSVDAEDAAARYAVDTGRDVRFDVVFRAAGDEVVQTIERIEGDLRGIRFGGEPLVSVTSASGGWTLATAEMMTGGRLSNALAGSGRRAADWVVLSNGKVAVSVQNTIIRDPNVVRQERGMCGLAPNDWQYALKGDWHAPLYRAVIGVVADLNADRQVDWQDGAIFLQRHVPGELPDLIDRGILGWVGVEDAANNGMNATFPQVADIIRRQYHITAGEPTYMGLAGWCYWGWDSEYPAAEEASRRAGGNAGLVELCRDAWRYSSQISLCINFDDAYMHSPAWDLDIMCTHPDGSPHVYMYWAGGLAYHVCPYKDVTTGQAFDRIETMLDFGTAGSCYIDVLSAALDKTSEGPGGTITMLDNLVAKFQIADYYWSHGVKLYSEHCKYPFVGRILGGLNNTHTGLDTDRTRIPMPAFILHGKMNNFWSATSYGRSGRLLLGIVPNIGGNVFTPGADELDAIFLHLLPARTFVRERMTRFQNSGTHFRVDYTGGTWVSMRAGGGELKVISHGRQIADNTTSFVPREKGGYWAYSSESRDMTYPLPEGWSAERIRVFALNRDGRHEEVFGVASVRDGNLVLRMFARVPCLVTDGEDLVAVASEDYGRFARRVGSSDFAPQAPAPAPAPAGNGLRIVGSAVQTPHGTAVAIRRHENPAAYRDKRTRPKDAVLLFDGSGELTREIPILGPVTDLVYDERRGQLIAGMGAFNYDGLQFIDPQAGRVVGLLPLVPESWGEDLKLAVSGDVLYVAAPQTANVAAVALDVPWPQAAARWAARIFEEGTDPRDPEAAMDEFLRVRWDRLRSVHQLGMAPRAMDPLPDGGVRVHVADTEAGPFTRIDLVPTDGPWVPWEEAGDRPAPFPRLARALELPRERIVATSLPGNAQPWWLTLPREKHHIVPEPQPANAFMLPSVGPRYETVEAAREHAALVAALRCRNILREKTTMPLVWLGERRGVDRGALRSGYDFWMVAYMYARDLMTPEWVMGIVPEDAWYVETLEMPDGRTLYRAGLLAIVPADRFEEVYRQALAGEEQWYRQAAERESDPQRRKQLEDFAALFEAAPREARVNWMAP